MPHLKLLVLSLLLAGASAQAQILPPLPVARDDSYELNALTLQVSAPGLLANDSGTDLSVIGYTIPGQGRLTSIVTDGSFRYTPSYGFAGTTSFDYVVSDRFDRIVRATVHIDASRSVPVARDDYYTPTSGTFSIGAPGLLANDTGGIGSVIVAGYRLPSAGSSSSATSAPPRARWPAWSPTAASATGRRPASPASTRSRMSLSTSSAAAAARRCPSMSPRCPSPAPGCCSRPACR